MTLRDTLTAAIRMTGARSLGEAPEASELNLALELFQNMALTVPSVTLTDVLTSVDYEAGEYERVFNSGGSPITVTLPETITDATTGDVRPPVNGAIVEVAASGARHIYVSQLGAWKELTNLALTSEQPFGTEHEQGVRAMVAIRLCPELKKPPTDVLAGQAEMGMRSLRQRFRQVVPATFDLALTGNSVRTRWAF